MNERSEENQPVEIESDALDGVIGGVRVPEECIPICPALDQA